MSESVRDALEALEGAIESHDGSEESYRQVMVRCIAVYIALREQND